MNFDLAGLKVMIAMPAHRDIPPKTVASLLETKTEIEGRGIPVSVLIPEGGSIVESARSQCTNSFLQSDNNRLFFIDSDIVWKPDAFLRLLCLSTVMDVVLASYPIKRDPLTFFINCAREEIATNEYGCLPNVGAGLGFTCIQRHIIEKLAERAPKLIFADAVNPIPHLFRCGAADGKFVGEDIGFFDDIKALGVNVYLDPTIELGHHGSKTFTGRLIDHLKQDN